MEIQYLLKTNVDFFEQGHYYQVEGVRVKYTLTEVLKKLGLAPNYETIPAQVLENAKQRGTLLHERLEQLDNTGALEIEDNDPYLSLIEDYINKGQDVIISELAVSYDTLLATKIDKIIEEDGQIIVADVKTTASMNLDYVTYQCSLGALMLQRTTGIKATKGRLIWLDRNSNKCKLINFNLIDFTKLEELIKAIEEGNFDYLKSQSLISLPVEISNSAVIVRSQLSIIKEAEAKIKELKEQIASYMVENGIDKMKDITGEVTFTMVAESTRRTFDTKKALAENPELEKYYKESVTKSYLKIT